VDLVVDVPRSWRAEVMSGLAVKMEGEVVWHPTPALALLTRAGESW